MHEWGIFNVLTDALVRKLCMKMLKESRATCGSPPGVIVADRNTTCLS